MTFRSRLFIPILLLAGFGAHAALVGTAGYTNNFSAPPAAADFATATVAGGNGDVTDAVGFDAAVAALTAGAITTQIPESLGAPAAAAGTATYSGTTDKNLQLRPTGTKMNVVMATLINNYGANATSVQINYNLSQAAVAAEQVDGVRVYYSLTGAANSWTFIPGLSSTAAGFLTANVTLSSQWTNSTALYLLFADDNGAPSPDTANQIANFFITITGLGTQLPVTITNSPPDRTISQGQSTTFNVGVSGTPPITYQWYRGVSSIVNATNASYTLSGAQVSDNGVQFSVVAANVASNISYTATSSVATLTVLVDNTAPTIVNITPVPGLRTNLTQITVTFSEAVQGVTAAHLLVAGVAATSVSAVNSSIYSYTFLQPPFGTVPITWSPAQTITDLALPPNPFDRTGPGATWTYTLVDLTPPIVSILTPLAGTTVSSLSNLTVLFSEAVTGVDAADLLINNVAASSMTVDGPSQFTFRFPQPATGMVQVAWAAGHGITDLAADPNNFAGGNWTYLLDTNGASPYISEFMASNTRILADETGQFPDWIEIYNPGAAAVNMAGWSLTDNANNLTKWIFPATNLPSGGFMVVFASGNNRRVPGAPLHTSFSLSASGEYLGLVKPDGVTIVSEFRPAFPGQVPDVSYGVAQFGSPPLYTAGTNGVYFTTPTPGSANLGGVSVPGPVIESVKHTPNVPLDNEDLLVTARVLPSFAPVSTVTLRYRIMFDAEVTLPMFDDGAHGDGAAGDGIFGATIPASASTNGQMIRYLIAATDTLARPSRWPLFATPTNSAEYLGTIVNPTNVTSKLPIFHLFAPPAVLQMGPTTSQTGADSESGGRVAIFYDGEFYDNVYMELRGNTSAGFNKKSHRLEFNREHAFRHAGPGGRSIKSSFMAEYVDPAYLRQHLCFWLLDKIGVPAPYFYPVRLQLNGKFDQLAYHNDVIGQEQVARLGYDPAGALYKAVGTFETSFFSTGVFQKLEPKNDTSRTDYLALASGINESSTLTVRRNTVFDMLDLPEVINHLAGTRWCGENDDVWANMSMYRDTFGDQLWRNIPFDMNASWGQRYGGSDPLDVTTDSCKSHPLFGGSTIIACDGPGAPDNFNRLYDVIIAVPETRQMYLRRMRSIIDQIVQPPGTPANALILENHIKSMTNLISAEASLDRAFWGFSPWAGET